MYTHIHRACDAVYTNTHTHTTCDAVYTHTQSMWCCVHIHTHIHTTCDAVYTHTHSQPHIACDAVYTHTHTERACTCRNQVCSALIPHFIKLGFYRLHLALHYKNNLRKTHDFNPWVDPGISCLAGLHHLTQNDEWLGPGDKKEANPASLLERIKTVGIHGHIRIKSGKPGTRTYWTQQIK